MLPLRTASPRTLAKLVGFFFLILAQLGVVACVSSVRRSDTAESACDPACADTGQIKERTGVYDPFEPLNRQIFRFNVGLDTVIINPTLRLYRAATIPPMRSGISNFLRNLVELPNALNIFLQNNPRGALLSLERFVINSTLGIGGLVDVAAHMGLERQDESFVQTLIVWGMKPGPYLVIPIFGPSRMRDALGLGISFAVTPLIAPYSLTGQPSGNIAIARIGTLRERYLDLVEEVYATQVDPYTATRDFYARSIERSALIRGLPTDPVLNVGNEENEEQDAYDDLTDFDDS